MTVSLLGYIGAALFAFCSLPQSIECIRQGHAEGINPLFIWMWFLGEVITALYVYLKHGFDIPLIGNYLINIVFLLIIVKFLYFPRNKKLDF